MYPSRKHTKQKKAEDMRKNKIKEQTAPYAIDPFSVPLDPEEQWIEDHLDEFVPVPNQEQEKERMRQAAIYTIELRKNKNINLRLQGTDVVKLKEIAAH